jgi:1,4-alpha-glucan branching enzyme
VGDLNGGVRLVTAIDSATPNSYRARKLSTLGAALTFTAPGVPMLFQGQEMLENRSFNSSLPVDWSKTNTYSYIVQFYRDLIGVRRNLKGYTPGLEGDGCAMLQVDNINKLIAFHRWKSTAPNQDALVVANFSNLALSNYALPFPAAGTWFAHLNSDQTKYGPDYGNIGSSVVTASGSPIKGNITIGPYSVLVLSQTPDVPPQVTINPGQSALNIGWPNAYSGWVLTASTSLGATASWSQVPPSQYQTNPSNTFVTFAPTGATCFYRLQKL